MEIEGSELMLKVMFAAAFAVGMITAPMPGFVSTAAAQQQAPASDKTAKSKKEPSTGQLAARERQKKCRCRMEGGKGRQQSRKRNDVAEILERLQQTSQVRVELARRKNFPARMNNRLQKTRL